MNKTEIKTKIAAVEAEIVKVESEIKAEIPVVKEKLKAVVAKEEAGVKKILQDIEQRFGKTKTATPVEPPTTQKE